MPGVVATKTPIIRGMRSVKKETLRLIDNFIQRSDNIQVVKDSMVPPLFEVVLIDYTQSVEPARDPEVLNVVSTLLAKLGDMMAESIPMIFNSVFELTLSMINKDFSEYPEHRVAFFKLIESMNNYCFTSNNFH